MFFLPIRPNLNMIGREWERRFFRFISCWFVNWEVISSESVMDFDTYCAVPWFWTFFTKYLSLFLFLSFSNIYKAFSITRNLMIVLFWFFVAYFKYDVNVTREALSCRARWSLIFHVHAFNHLFRLATILYERKVNMK